MRNENKDFRNKRNEELVKSEDSNSTSNQVTPTPMVMFDSDADTNSYTFVSTKKQLDIPITYLNSEQTSSLINDDSNIKSSQPTPMVRFDYTDELAHEVPSTKPITSVPMVEFEDGIEPRTLPDIFYIPGPFVTFEKENEPDSPITEPRLQLPKTTCKNEFNMLSEDQLKMIRAQQEKLQYKGNAIHIAEKIFNGTDFGIDGGIIYNKSGEKICNFIPVILSETIHYFNTKNGYDKRSEYKVRLYLNSSSYDVIVWGDEIYDFKWLRKATGSKATIYANGRKGNFFNELLSNLLNKENYEVNYYYHTNGWHKIPYLGYRYLYDKGIIGKNNSNIYASLEHKLIYDENLVGSKAVFQDIIRMMFNVCNTSAISTVITLYTHLGVLTTLFELAEFPIKFIVALIGITNAKKTSLALNLTKLFDRCQSPKPDISFEATIGGIETSFSRYHDAVFVIDDLKPSNSKEKQKDTAKKLEKIVRAYGDRVPTVRMNDYSPNGKDVYYPIWGCCMLTGEYLDGVASTLARIVTINIDGRDVNDAELKYFQVNYKILSTHMVDFISYITDNFDSTVSYIKSRTLQIRSEVDKVFDIPRYKESYATLLVCAEIFLGYAINRNFLDDQEAHIYLNQFVNSIHTIIALSDGNIVELNPGMVTLQAIDNYVTSGFIKIYTEGQSPSQSDEYYAYIEDDYLYIRLEVAYKILLKYLRSLNLEPSVTAPKHLLPFLQGLDVIRVIKKDNKTRSTHKLKNRTTETRFLYIKRKKMKELLQNENLY